MNRIRYTLFVVAIFLALVGSAVISGPVFADEAVPPTSETPSTEETVTEETPPTQTDDSGAVEETDSAPETETKGTVVAELIESLPEGTQLVVTDEAGEAIPLASQEAADAVAFIDPVWCPVGVAPQDGLNGCTTAYTNLKDLIDNLMAGTAGVVPNTHGVIWIQEGTDLSSGSMILDGDDTVGAALGNMEDFSLTLQGGWNGTYGSKTIVGTSTITNSLGIINWNGAITINNIIFSGIVSSTTPNSAALEIQTTKNITIIKVEVSNNTGAGTVNGAHLDNEDTSPSVFGNVSVSNSKFVDNKNVGLIINSEGTITLANVLVNGNDGGGAYLNNSYATTAKTVTIVTGANEFNNNSGIGNGSGLNILSNGAVTIKDLTANNNGGHGIYIHNYFDNIASSVTITGTTIAGNNTWNGIEVYSNGTITASNLIANSNGGKGVYLDNYQYSLTDTPYTVTVSGNNQFKFNGDTGLFIMSSGNVSLKNITATYNGFANIGIGGGIYVYTGGFSYSGNSNKSAVISISGVKLLNNMGNGADLGNSGSIIVSNIVADGNTQNGATIQSDYKSVSITGINSFNNNGSKGLSVFSLGTINVSNVTADNNTNGRGIELDNYLPNLSAYFPDGGVPQNITLTGYVNANGNGASGIVIYTYGTVSMSNVSANDNSGTGIFVQNNLGHLPRVVTIAGFANASGNGGDGITVYSLSAISLNNVNASYNNGGGVFAQNNYTGYTGGITLNGITYLSNNGFSGLFFLSNGNIILKDLDAVNNGHLHQDPNDGYGAYINNIFGTGLVTIGTNKPNWANSFSGNYSYGLVVFTNNTVITTNLLASGNTNGGGIYIDNTSSLLPKNVTLNGYNSFYNNGGNGLSVFTQGAITTNNLRAEGNSGHGAILENCVNVGEACDSFVSPVAKNVTLNGINSLNFNTQSGLMVYSLGVIKISNLTANQNGEYGAYLRNNDGENSASVTLTGSTTTNSNNMTGLWIQTRGAVTLGSLTANSNFQNGAFINANNLLMSVAKVTITGKIIVNKNQADGLTIYSDNAITLGNITANENTLNGVYLNNIVHIDNLDPFSEVISWSTATLKISGINNFNHNGSNGLVFSIYGAVDITNLTADFNDEDAAQNGSGVDGYSHSSKITFTCGSMTDNGTYGWKLNALTTITLKGVFVIGNSNPNQVNLLGGTLVTTRACPLP